MPYVVHPEQQLLRISQDELFGKLVSLREQNLAASPRNMTTPSVAVSEFNISTTDHLGNTEKWCARRRMYVLKTFEESQSPGECAAFLRKALEQYELLQHHQRNLRRNRRNHASKRLEVESDSDPEGDDDSEATSDEESLGVKRREQAKTVRNIEARMRELITQHRRKEKKWPGAEQRLAYYYREAFRNDGHFTREHDHQTLPRDVIESTSWQQKAMQGIVNALRKQDKTSRDRSGGCGDEEERDVELKRAIRTFYISLICQTVGSRPFRSAVLSFCAILSRKRNRTRQRDNEESRLCTWRDPGNFNSNLSALTWTAQLILFDFVCFQKQDDEDRIPDLLDQMCKKYFQQMTETPYGHILQWRLYLFVASSTELTTYQARWSLDGETVDYMGKQLRMEQVSQLALSEFRQAQSLLYDELLFGMEDVAPIEAWRLNDDLDLEDYGASWITDNRNREILAGTHDALLRQIEGRASLRRAFIRSDQRGGRKSGGGNSGGTCLCPKAMAIYEAHVQEFLRRILTLIQVLPGPPLRSPELLSITYINTGPRRRSVLIWEKLVMIHVRYHKSQERTGAEKDNIRFLPPAVGDLILTYLAFVPPLRQVFLRQRKPGALLSPYLWSKLSGEVWGDGMVSSCLRRASARAEVPRFQVAWWRQVAASITKEKFSPKEQANFNLHEIATLDEVEDETELADLAGMSNHSFRTFNFAYAGSTTLTVTNSLHRAYRASQSWRSLFRIDSVLQGKRPRTVSEAQAQGSLLKACKKVQFRTRPVAREDSITSVARRLYNDPDLQLRRPGQRDALLATVGPHAPEQVVVILATGSGKTLIFMVGAALESSATTILILPTVALSGNMLGRLDKVALKHHIWHPGSRRSAPIVIVSAEAACTESFLEYANQLCSRQQLDRIVVDECHLTITAGSYRRSMSQLAWHVRQIRTQTIWLTATLPPVYQELFIEHNKLVRPHVIRESTNRPNIRYIVRRECGPGGLCERAVCLVQSCLTQIDLFFERGRDKVIIYCPTKELVAELAELLSCPSYTADSGTAEEKRAILEQWLAAIDSPVIVATSALGPGFDHPYIRCVIYIGAPVLLTDFSQESGRAGRDGKRAESIVLLSAAWQPQLDRRLVPDEEAMQLYLTQRYCLRGILSQFLDARPDWRWCMEGEELCDVCPEYHAQRRPPTLDFRLPPPAIETGGQGSGDKDQAGDHAAVEIMTFIGPAEVLRQDAVCDRELSQYEKDLETMMGCCLYCRVEGKPFEHSATTCARRHDWIRAKTKALRECQGKNKEWMDRFAVCWKCYQPQEICRAADPEYEEVTACQFPDMVIPLCFGAFSRPGRTQWFLKHFNQSFKTCHEYMLWLGKSALLGGSWCVNANCVASLLMAEF
ncbi:hypothetical protein IL306_014962 [Fusarium sp. DS 682]|nr:hypothetical protein IL306_014962 [Fusarium sp. DS 682]